MLVSAIIPCYNASTTVGRAIDSILRQSIEVEQVILVNDGSNDDTLDILKQYGNRNPCIQIIDQKNQGVSYARNAGIQMAKGEFLLMLDADDYFEPSFVGKALKKFSENKNFAAVMCGYYRVVNGKKILPYIPQPISLKTCLLRNGALSCLLFRKSMLEAIGGYDVAFDKGFEDWDLNIRILKAGKEFGIVKEVLFHYTDTSGSRTSIADSNETSLKLQLYDKYRSDYEIYARYHYQELNIEIQKLKAKNTALVESNSYKSGHLIMAALKKISNLFQKK